MDDTHTLNQVCTLLQRAYPASLSRSQIALSLDLTERQVREAIAAARLRGWLIVPVGESQVRIASSPHEVKAFLNSLAGQVDRVAETITAMTEAMRLKGWA